MRIAKAISERGICSRRKAEELIQMGKVSVNKEIITSPALNVSEADIIEIDGKIIPQKDKMRIWIYYKPAGLITTHNDPQNRPTIFDALPKNMPRVISVGRLDLQSEGLILLTNSGEFAREMELPSSKIERIYKVRCFGKLAIEKLRQAEKGIEIDGEFFHPKLIRLIESKNNNHWLEITLTEGKNREIRKILGSFWPKN
jgi:23S rRNA pseudouridine2605 synthase